MFCQWEGEVEGGGRVACFANSFLSQEEGKEEKKTFAESYKKNILLTHYRTSTHYNIVPFN